MLYYILITIAFIPLTIFFPTIVRGRKNLKRGKAIFTANHRSNMDSIIVYLKANRKMHFVAKKEKTRYNKDIFAADMQKSNLTKQADRRYFFLRVS